jgi:hypothetical protein
VSEFAQIQNMDALLSVMSHNVTVAKRNNTPSTELASPFKTVVFHLM